MDYSKLDFADVRKLGQDPPNWLLLRTNGLAYIKSVGRTCTSIEAYRRTILDNEDSETACAPAVEEEIRLQEIEPQGEESYIVSYTPTTSDSPIRYVGAGQLSPDIPAGTELLVPDPQPPENDDDDTDVNLLDRDGNSLATLLPHTRVSVRQMIYDWPLSTVAVTVSSGEYSGREGYIYVSDLVASTGDGFLYEFLGAEK